MLRAFKSIRAVMTCDFHGIRAKCMVTEEVPDGEYTIPIGVADIKREGTDVTIVSRKIIKGTCIYMLQRN
jgi:pyruvate/2-oxoglutarate/acetoin dehydrogenase E1 component